MRVSSVTLPSCIGTLKSTRQNTLFPLTAISFNVFLFISQKPLQHIPIVSYPFTLYVRLQKLHRKTPKIRWKLTFFGEYRSEERRVGKECKSRSGNKY